MVKLTTWPARFDWLAHIVKATCQHHHLDLMPFLRPLIPVSGIVFDVGAHAGQMSKLFARMAPQGHIYAFEPGSYALSILESALWASRRRNIEIIPIGLSEHPGTATLRMPIKEHGGYGFGLSHLGRACDGRQVIEERVSLTTLDRFVFDRRIERVDFIKIDIEGWEAQCLRGGRETIARFLPNLMIEIVADFLRRADAKPEDVFGLLIGLGYIARRIKSSELIASYIGPGDYIFSHPSRQPAQSLK